MVQKKLNYGLKNAHQRYVDTQIQRYNNKMCKKQKDQTKTIDKPRRDIFGKGLNAFCVF